MSRNYIIFSDLPEKLAVALSHGSVGKWHLLSLAKETLAGPAGVPLGRELVLAAWEADPLDGDLAAELQRLFPDAGSRMMHCVHAVKNSWRRPERLDYYQRLLQKRDTEKIFTYLQGQQRKEPGNCYWLQQALGIAAYEGVFERLDGWLGHGNFPQALEEKILGDLAFFERAYGAAEQHYQAAHESGGLLLAQVRRMECLLRLGEKQSALDLGREVLEAHPWQTNLLLALHDILTGVAEVAGARSVLPGRVAVLLYTYNKADELQRTLDALVPQLPEYATVVVLDNGSTDGTAALLAGWNEQFSGQGAQARFRSIRLPVNIGAPAARNWLAAMEETRSFPWLAFLDDDALPPADWLERLGQAVAAYPDAGAWGCRVVDSHNPLLIQSADTHLTDPQEVRNTELMPAYQRVFGLSKLQHQDLDFGQFSYLRPCVSVTGCCHLFRRETLEQSNGFDLRFTPSQYDDVEHDLRLALDGKNVVYQGHLRVEHCKRTGRLGREDPQELARALGNMYKLQMKYTPEQIAELRRSSEALLRADLLAKAQRLRESGMQLDFWN